MAIYSKTLTGLINGVSRQPFQMRLESQGQEQINCISSVSKGVVRRPGMQLVTHYETPSAKSLNDHWHWIDRSENERWLVHIESNSTNIRVINLLTGAVVTPSGADSYIQSGVANGLRFLTIGDVTYIVNTAKVPEMATTRSPIPTPFAFVWVKAAIASCVFKINLKRAGATAVSAEYTTPAASSTPTTTATIADALADPTKTDPDATGFTLTSVGSSIVTVAPNQLTPSISVTFAASGRTITGTGFIAAGFSAGDVVTITGTTSNNGTFILESVTDTVLTTREALVNEGPVSATFTFYPDFTISTSDGWGDQALVAVKTRSKVQAFSSLPPVGVNGMIVEVEGDPETSIDSYFVRFVASGAGAKTTTINAQTVDTGIGVWEETVKWDTPTTISPTNMPRKLTKTGPSSFALSEVTWTARTVGDTVSAPDPSFIGSAIQDVAFFKNRLTFISGESVTFSGVGEYESFFPTTVTTLADDDAFDVTANFPDVAKLRYAIPFNDFLVLFSEAGIFGVRGSKDTGLTPKSVEFLRLASFSGTPASPPVFAGDRIFFTERSNTRLVVREFFPVDVDGTFTVESISEHVGEYIKGASFATSTLAADPTNGLMVLTSPAVNASAYVYQWFMSNREKVQSSWHAWSITGSEAPNLLLGWLASASIMRGDIYLVVYLTGGGPHLKWEIVKIPIDPEALTGLGTVTATNEAIPYLDYWQVVTGVNTGGNTTFDVAGSIRFYPNDAAVVALAYGTGWVLTQRGSVVSGATLSTLTGGITRLTFPGTAYVGRQLLIGLKYKSSYDFTPPIQKSQSNIPQLTGRYFARRWRARFAKPVTVTGRRAVGPAETFTATDARSLVFTQKRVCEFPVHREINETLQTGVYSDHPTQGFELYGVEWEIEWQPRARPA